MKIQLIVFVCFLNSQACALPIVNIGGINEPCADVIFELIEQRLPTNDAEGHGPDIGSDEWHSVVEFRLGIRGNNSVLKRHTNKWCAYIEKQLDDSNA